MRPSDCPSNMAYEPARPNQADTLNKFIDTLQNDFKNLASETKKKYPQIRESCEEAIVKLRGAANAPRHSLCALVNQILYPLVQGCESRDVKVVRLCLSVMQRLITQQLVDQKGARFITDALWALMESGIEEVKVLQTVTLLLTTNSVVHGETLARALVLCFRLHFARSSTTINTAGATVRQLVALVFERVVSEDAQNSNQQDNSTPDLEPLKQPSGQPPARLRVCAADAYLMFQDLVQLVNADQPYWLTGMTEMTRTFGLELLESVLANFAPIFHRHAEFSFLLKERVCALVIKLFSPNIKYRGAPLQHATPLDKPYFPISTRLLRLVSILVHKYHALLVTECEIFLSLVVKFLEPEKPRWQRALALEVLHRLCVQPELLTAFCRCYDLRPHATNILQDMVNALGSYVQSVLLAPPQNHPTTPIQPNTAPQPAQRGFASRGPLLPLVVTFPGGTAKATYLEMLDKTEPPPIPDGYGISVAYACLLDLVRSLQSIVQAENDRPEPELQAQLINSSWCGLLAALCPLVDACTDEQATEAVLKALQTCAALCGLLELRTPRDAFITALCRASLPPHYALQVLGSVQGGTAVPTQQFSAVYGANEGEFRPQVVVVGTPLPTAALPAGAHQGPVMLTNKNLQCMRALLVLAHCHGGLLGTAWHLVLATLQHLVWILGLKPSTGGSLKAGRPAPDTNAVITNAVMADLPVLSAMLSRLFEASQHLDDVALHHLIDALCQLSHEACELACSNREPSLFAVAKLLETGLVNLPRVEVLWRPLTSHLLEVCHHPHIRMREWGVEAVTYLVKAALQHKHAVPLKESPRLQTLLLGPLSELSGVPHGDVRQRQLECVLQVLHGTGEALTHGWPLVLDVIGAVSAHRGEALVRVAFQCLQLVVTDFLPIMPARCLPQCVDTVTQFGRQTEELNISLTAVGLMWNISDYFQQNRARLSDERVCEEEGDVGVLPAFPGTPSLSGLDRLWMCLYLRLAELCVDPRPAVRKSAGQTLFSTLAAHGALLAAGAWRAVLWQVLFPLLEQVRALSSSASTEKFDTGGHILIHHSRNTAQKQWAETQVLTLSGVARVFNTKRTLLQSLGDFSSAWLLLLEFVEHAALARNDEVSLAALKSLQELLKPSQPAADKPEMWSAAWRVWLNIALESTSPPPEIPNTTDDDTYIPTQAFLSTLVQIFPLIFGHIKSQFSSDDVSKLCSVLWNAVIVPVQGECAPYTMSALNDSALTPLHDSVLLAVDLLIEEAEIHSSLLPAVFKQLLAFSKLASNFPCYKSQHEVTSSSLNYVPFGERALRSATQLYERHATTPQVVQSHVLRQMVEALHVPLALKYACPSSSTWQIAAESLLTILRVGLPQAAQREQDDDSAQLWRELAATLQDFLFPRSEPPVERGLDELVRDEALDCRVVELLRAELLPHARRLPHDFIASLIALLNRGSIHSTATGGALSDCEAELTIREEFAKTCFETLLHFSLFQTEPMSEQVGVGNNGEPGPGRLAITTLLHRFKEVVKQFNEDERQSGKCPLPRFRLAEISFVLKAITTLVGMMKQATTAQVSPNAWSQLIELYPHLVDCTTTGSLQVSRPLRDALLQYCDLLRPPNNSTTLC